MYIIYYIMNELNPSTHTLYEYIEHREHAGWRVDQYIYSTEGVGHVSVDLKLEWMCFSVQRN